jgi:sarcosine oxidase, subunit beta
VTAFTDAPLPRSADVVIVGAGVAGLALAYELGRRGVHDVLVIERAYPGAGATGRNVARIRAMQLTEQLCRVASRCQDKYEQMGAELRFNVLFYRLGYLWLLYEPDEVARMREVVAMHQRIGVQSRFLEPADVLRMVPALVGGDAPTGGVVHDDAIVHHDAVVWAYLESLAGSRARLATRTAVTAIEQRDGQVSGVVTSRGRVATRTVVNAAGSWSTQLNEFAGVRAPVQPYRREVLVTAPVTRFIDKAVTFYRPTEGWFNQTLRGEVVMGVVDPAEPAGHSHRSSFDFLRRTATLIARKAPALADLTVIRQWAGTYDVTPDHLPLIGATAQLRGWWLAHGWSGRGMLLAPYLAELLSLEIAEGRRDALLAGFEPDRFAGAHASHELETDYYGRYRPRAQPAAT